MMLIVVLCLEDHRVEQPAAQLATCLEIIYKNYRTASAQHISYLETLWPPTSTKRHLHPSRTAHYNNTAETGSIGDEHMHLSCCADSDDIEFIYEKTDPSYSNTTVSGCTCREVRKATCRLR